MPCVPSAADGEGSQRCRRSVDRHERRQRAVVKPLASFTGCRGPHIGGRGIRLHAAHDFVEGVSCLIAHGAQPVHDTAGQRRLGMALRGGMRVGGEGRRSEEQGNAKMNQRPRTCAQKAHWGTRQLKRRPDDKWLVSTTPSRSSPPPYPPQRRTRRPLSLPAREYRPRTALHGLPQQVAPAASAPPTLGWHAQADSARGGTRAIRPSREASRQRAFSLKGSPNRRCRRRHRNSRHRPRWR